MPSGRQSRKFLICQERPALGPIPLREAAKLCKQTDTTLYYKAKKAKGAWFEAGPLHFKISHPPAKRSALAPAPIGDLRQRLQAALERGQDGVYTEGELKLALGWADNVQRQAKRLELALDGKADLTIDQGQVRVLWTDIELSKTDLQAAKSSLEPVTAEEEL